VFNWNPKLNGAYNLLVYADNMNLLWENIYTIQKNTETLTDASTKVGLEVNAEKSKSRYQKAGQNHTINIANLYSSPNIIRVHYAMKMYGGVNV
jgi:ABC-type transport system involved in cytochrome c biogenesis ATPase subunit